MRKAIDPAAPPTEGGSPLTQMLHQPLQQVLVACVAAVLAIAIRGVIDPWIGDRHEFLPLYLAIAAATWFAGWQAGALGALLFFISGEALFGAPRSMADATKAHDFLATVSYWVVCGFVLAGTHLAWRDRIRLKERLRELGESDQRKSGSLALLAHELRNPLSVLSTGTETIRQGELDNQTLDSTWRTVARQTEHMQRLVDDLIDTARVEQGTLALEPQTVDIAALVAQAAADAEPYTSPKRQRIRLSLPGSAGYVPADPQRIGQVLDNLLHNASKFSPEGSLIEVALAAEPTGVSVAVRDCGIGIAPGDLDGVFASFCSGGTPRQGLGLGLALCRKLVHMHGGSIEARSAGLGHGAEFVVRLPRPPELAVGTDPWWTAQAKLTAMAIAAARATTAASATPVMGAATAGPAPDTATGAPAAAASEA